ncbi:hypothetical protein BpHYR1_053642 [Brachionus plicatilis]|uniref:Uncharacterized protein n=1 Tax=Brachionus plicatilis TaxID=10195 RepID=A0A3M7QQG8_BRAPC|nr:hypothetical protein BpHYR1_053642 [Brachionus plicatilis]
MLRYLIGTMFKLPYSGREVELIKRLNDHFKVQDNEEVNDEVEEEEDTIGNGHGGEEKKTCHILCSDFDTNELNMDYAKV